MKFCTAINCIDGRVQLPVIKYLKDKCSVDFVDMITEAGPDKIFSLRQDLKLENSILKKCNISINRQGAIGLLAIVAHHDCLGNPITDAEHKEQLRSSVKTLQEKYQTTKVIGLWVDSDSSVSEIY